MLQEAIDEPMNGTHAKNGHSVPAKKFKAEDVFKCKKLGPNAKIPTRASERSAGYDLYASQGAIIPARGKQKIKTDLAIAVPDGCYGRIAPRSGLAWKHSIDTGAGVIDADYRGEVGVILFNHGDADYEIKKDDRVAQLILQRIAAPAVQEVDELDDTTRGQGGYGSTGK
eukprot:m.310841 g.310841  ORF g.310841 m.310841 type:complete len:170 (+) comp55465_c0_seq1:84-593(+)